MRRTYAFATLAAALLAGNALQAQSATAPQRHVYAATSQPGQASEMVLVNSLIEERTRSGELVRVSAQTDDELPGRLHEYFAQVHRNVPVHGAGFSRQSADGVAVSVFGTMFSGVDIDTDPALGPEAARSRMEALADAAAATTEPPKLVIVPTALGQLVLAWSAPMMDFRTYFVDAHSGEPVHQIDHQYTEAAVGFGSGITGAPQKVSAWKSGSRYQAWDRLRPAEIVTLDAGGEILNLVSLLIPGPAWEEAVAVDDDNQWANPAIVDGHANLGLAYDYLFKSQGQRGMDGQDGRIFSIANVNDFRNALFLSMPFGPQGTGVLAFGDVSGGGPFVPLDVVGHELMHGVTYSALTERTGLPLLDTHTFIPGPSALKAGGEVIRCGDSHTFQDDVTGPYLCFDENGEPTQSRSGRFALFWAQGGAVNEAYSDIVGTSVEFMFHPPGDGPLRADYLNGEDATTPIRRIDAPHAARIGPFTYPDAIGQEFRFVVALVGERLVRYTGYGVTNNRPFRSARDGYDGVHWNSTILSHAFYLAIEGGEHRSTGTTVQGVGGANRLQIEQAFFRGLVDLAPPRSGFFTIALAIRQASLDLHGAGSSAYSAIDQALTAVGL